MNERRQLNEIGFDAATRGGLRGNRLLLFVHPRQFNELESLPAEARQRVWRAATERLPLWILLGPSLGFGVGLSVVLTLVDTPLETFFARWSRAAGITAAETLVRGLLAGVAAIPLILGATVAQSWFIRRRLLGLIPHLCNPCGYDLTSNTSGICPECGREVSTPADSATEAAPNKVKA